MTWCISPVMFRNCPLPPGAVFWRYVRLEKLAPTGPTPPPCRDGLGLAGVPDLGDPRGCVGLGERRPSHRPCHAISDELPALLKFLERRFGHGAEVAIDIEDRAVRIQPPLQCLYVPTLRPCVELVSAARSSSQAQPSPPASNHPRRLRAPSATSPRCGSDDRAGLHRCISFFCYFRDDAGPLRGGQSHKARRGLL